MEEQGAATPEIARNVQQAAKGTAQVATNITDVNRGASETGSASAQVLSSAQSLSNESSHLKVEVEKFLLPCAAGRQPAPGGRSGLSGPRAPAGPDRRPRRGGSLERDAFRFVHILRW